MSAMLAAMKGHGKSSRRDDYSTVRIIAGQWRGRKLRFRADGVRPTGDRVRETLFNWLAPYLTGARCLDWFAGTGVLGLEALSRGAATAVLVERNPQVAGEIGRQIDALRADHAELVCADALQLQLNKYGPFDVVFVDPPFVKAADGETPESSLADLCTLLESSGALAPQAFIYLETDRKQPLPTLPDNWQLKREKTAGQVRYALAERHQPEAAEE